MYTKLFIFLCYNLFTTLLLRRYLKRNILKRQLEKNSKNALRAEQMKASNDRIQLNQLQYNSATHLQKSYRGRLTRRGLDVQHEAAIDLQRVIRGRKARRTLCENITMGDHAVLIQTQWRRKSEQDTYQMLLATSKYNAILDNAATNLQKNVRKRQCKHLLATKKQNKLIEDEKRNLATLRIQTITRGRRQRKSYVETRNKRIDSANKMQSIYRGHLSRRLLTIYVVASIRIQNFYRSYIIRQKWKSLRIDIRTIIKAEQLFRLDATTRRVTSPKSGKGIVQLHEKPTDRDGNDALMLASRSGSIRLVRLCLSTGYLTSNINNSDKQTALHLAASAGAGRLDICKLLIQAGSDIAATDSLGRSICHVASASGDDQILKYLCDLGAPLEMSDRVSGGRTPLHCAAYFDNASCVQVLLYAGANVNVKSTTGATTPLHTAAARGANDVVHLLSEYEADIDVPDLGGNTPLHLACAAGHLSTVKTLLEFACITDVKNRSGDTPAHFSASMGHEDVFHLLMDYNQYITHVRNERGQTPMEAARSTGQVRLVKTIQQRLQVRSNEEHPPIEIKNNANDEDQNNRSLVRTQSHVSVTEEVDPFEDNTWGGVAPPPIHSPPPMEKVEDRSDISSDSSSSSSGSGNESSDLSDDEDLMMAAPVAKNAQQQQQQQWEGEKATAAGGSSERSSSDIMAAMASSSARSSPVASTTTTMNHAAVNSVNALWTEMWDEHHQTSYYQRNSDAHSQWEIPEGFVSEWGTDQHAQHVTYRNDHEEHHHAEQPSQPIVEDATHRISQEEEWASQRYYEEEENWGVEEETTDGFAVPPPPLEPPTEEQVQAQAPERSMSFTM